MSFQIALSGLDASSTALRVTGNNIANASTTGFKYSRPEFADIFAISYGGISSTAVGGGVRVADVAQQFDQGTIDFTGNNLDLAITGEGFFVLDDGGTRAYSRAGAFQVDRNGFVINAHNQRLQAYQALDPDGNSFNTTAPGDLQLVTSAGAPQATTNISGNINLDADGEDLGAGVIDPPLPDTYNYSTSVTLYDSLGGSHTSTMYFRKTGPNTWDVAKYIDGAPLTSGGGANAQSTLTFNPDGTIAAGGVINYDAYPAAPAPVLPNGADPLNLTLDLSGSTQYGGGFSVNDLSQDGFTTGQLSNVQIDELGVVAARFTNGQLQVLGKVALADFTNPNGLQQLGDNAWAESFASGPVRLGEAGQGSLGLFQTGGLEASNVDTAEQLVNLITAQRNYQANAQVISTMDAITQTMINIR